MRFMICLTLMTFSFSAEAREYLRELGSCSIKLSQEDIETRRVELPAKAEASYEVVSYKEKGITYLVKSEFQLSPVPRSAVPLSEAFKTSLRFQIKEQPKYLGRIPTPHFSSLVGRDDVVNLINHLASKEVLSVEDPLEIQAVGSLVIPRDYDNQNWEWSGSYLFEYPEGYMFNFVTGFRVQAHLPTHVKNGLSFHIEVKCSDPYSVQTELLLFERPGLTGTIHSVSGSSLGQSSERARKRCGQNEEAQVIFERGTQSSWPDATTIVRCLPIEAL